jgi:putative ABC transport system ATP-binding protein
MSASWEALTRAMRGRLIAAAYGTGAEKRAVRPGAKIHPGRAVIAASVTETDGSQGEREPTERTDDVVRFEAVTKTYEGGRTVEALSGVALSLAAGSYTAVMGPSGSGKSTLLNLVGGLDTPTAGSVMVNGRDLAALTEAERARVRGRDVGFVFQTFNLMPRLTAVQNVALPLVFQGVDRGQRRERAADLLADVGLGDRTDHLPSELSGGQRQRVAIARALAGDPALLLADEPTGNVDTDTGERIMREFAQLHDAGNTILLVTHERRIAEHAERIVHVRDGEIRDTETLDGDGPAAPASDAAASPGDDNAGGA